MIRNFAVLALLLATPAVRADSANWRDSLSAWIPVERVKAITTMESNISPPPIPTSSLRPVAGVVLASPSTENPDYYYHWERDGALTMNVVAGLYEKVNSPLERAQYEKRMQDYFTFSRANQLSQTLSGGLEQNFRGYGEPKFYVNGVPYDKPWGRPQNDGPALRALTTLRYLRARSTENRPGVLSQLYDLDPMKSLLKSDLEFVAAHWADTCFDLWEETKGHHFYTEMVQRRALLEGAEIAELAQDPKAAQKYREEALKLETEIGRHIDPKTGVILTTLDRDGGIDYKKSNLDASVILAAQHARGGSIASLANPYFSATNEHILATAVVLDQTFRKLYHINSPLTYPQAKHLGTGIGRYPEDRYDGLSTSMGNPWVLLTLALAELDYQVARDLTAAGRLEITALSAPFYNRALLPQIALSAGDKIEQNDPRFARIIEGLHRAGDQYVDRVRFHAPADGSLAEEIQRTSGEMHGARDLTWNYAAFITATDLR